MDLFNSRKTRARIPNLSLRATMVGMKGTRKGELAIDHILNAKMPDGSPRVKIVGFGLPEEWVGDLQMPEQLLIPVPNSRLLCLTQ